MPRPVRRDPTWVAYVEAMGREPRNLPEDHPDRWQWEYRGGKREREILLGRLTDRDRQTTDQDRKP